MAVVRIEDVVVAASGKHVLVVESRVSFAAVALVAVVVVLGLVVVVRVVVVLVLALFVALVLALFVVGVVEQDSAVAECVVDPSLVVVPARAVVAAQLLVVDLKR